MKQQIVEHIKWLKGMYYIILEDVFVAEKIGAIEIGKSIEEHNIK